MREIRPSGSEGGGVLPRALPTPIRHETNPSCSSHGSGGSVLSWKLPVVVVCLLSCFVTFGRACQLPTSPIFVPVVAEKCFVPNRSFPDKCILILNESTK